ncbi:hypothetical protein YC2023_103820 [Brassica napus]
MLKALEFLDESDKGSDRGGSQHVSGCRWPWRSNFFASFPVFFACSGSGACGDFGRVFGGSLSALVSLRFVEPVAASGVSRVSGYFLSHISYYRSLTSGMWPYRIT